jgi:hypothetical protein
MEGKRLKSIIESLIFVSGNPRKATQIDNRELDLRLREPLENRFHPRGVGECG